VPLAAELRGTSDLAAARPEEPEGPEMPVVGRGLALDVRVLEALIGTDIGTVNQFVDAFHSSAEKLADELRSAYASGQIGNVAVQAHKLKSSARAVGALQLGELCDAMERAGKAKNALALAALMPVFDQETGRVSRFIVDRELAHAS
jgi:HPt (histidine-containing phosphotransfer) domain-containing protein